MNIPPIKIPTDDEMKIVAQNWYSGVGYSFYENWPNPIRANAQPCIMIPIPVDVINDLYINKDNHTHSRLTTIMEFAKDIDKRLALGSAYFFKLNSRSGKDAWVGEHPPVTVSGRQVVYEMMTSVRLMEDLAMFRYLDLTPAYACFRKYYFKGDITSEYRCFVKNKEVIGISYYKSVDAPLHRPSDSGKSVYNRINDWYLENIRPYLHVDNIVIDVFVTPVGSDALNVQMIEFNPYGLSDPVCFRSYAEIETCDYIGIIKTAKSHVVATQKREV